VSTAQHVRDLDEHGYAIVRGVFDAREMAAIQGAVREVYGAGLQHPKSWRHGNRYYEVNDDPEGGHVVLQAHWVALDNPVLEQYRRHPKLLALLEPLLGNTIRQSTNQLHWKPPGAKFVTFSYHQDARFTGLDPHDVDWLMPFQITTGLAIDPQRQENGALRVFPGSHRLGYLGLADSGKGYLMSGRDQEAELRAAGLDPADAVTLEMEPGDLAFWTLLTIHGSGPNRSGNARAFGINAYVNGAKISHGEPAFIDGRSAPLDPASPGLLNTDRPDPHYVEADEWMEG